MNIDWETAPDWAIGHALYAFGGEICEVWVGEGKYQRLDQPKSFPYGGGVGETRHNPCRYQFRYETLRPAPWNCESLPPIGTVCWHGEKKEVHRIIAHIDQGAAAGTAQFLAVGQLGYMGQLTLATAEYWKPIRTPGQIAAEEKQKWCRDALLECGHLHPSLELSLLAQSMYDKGYRKQVTE